MMRKACFSMHIFLLLVVLTATALFCVWLALFLSLPQSAGETRLPELGETVEIRFDAWQRPYVRAATLTDAMQAQGWLHAQHRLWQMELLRRAGQGRLAELMGSALLPTDRELWRVGVPQLATRLESNSSAETLALIDQYLAGVNSAIDQLTLLPPEFLLLRAARPRWQRRDVFALGALMAFQSANNLQHELLRYALVQKLDTAHASVFLRDEDGGEAPGASMASHSGTTLANTIDRLALVDPEYNPRMPRLGFGSNGWVVSGGRSASGAPLYAFDSHDDLGLPNLFYEVHLFFGNGLQIRGWSVPGLPGVINGFNQSIAWGFTNIGDTQDLFLETQAIGDPLVFRDGNEWYRARHESVSIPVRGAATEELSVVHTRNGPLISEQPPISLAWTVHRIARPNLDSLLALNLAQDWRSFTTALDRFPAPTLNATYADTHGTIGLRTAGVIPRRGAGVGLVPLDGSVAANRWQGLIPAAEMPQSSNPATGFLAAANARVELTGAPLVSADNAPGYRINRIHAVLTSNDAMTVDAMQDLQMDWTDGQAKLILPAMLTLLDRERLDSVARDALPLLEHWAKTPVAGRDSAGALIFQQWYLSLAATVFEGPTAELYPRLLARGYLLNHALDHLILHAPASVWWRGDQRQRLTESLDAAVALLAARLGPEPHAWRLDGLLHVELQHELGKGVPALGWLFNQPRQPWGGSPATVGRARYSYREPFKVNSGATVRAIAEMGAVPKVWSILPGGQSGHPLSRHYNDQYAGWLAGELLPIASFPDQVDHRVLRLVPGI
jgi:penicillin G amidase